MGSRAESGKSKGFSCTWDSLRNSAGEKILQLRSHPLGMPSDSNFCSLLNDLSVEQRFDVSYLDLGEFTNSAGLASKEMRSKWTSLATHTNRAACKYNQWDGAYDKLFLGCRVLFGVYASTAFTAFGSIPQINDMQCGFYYCRKTWKVPAAAYCHGFVLGNHLWTVLHRWTTDELLSWQVYVMH